MRWIGLTGKMGAGKDYAYTVMHSMNDRVLRVSFADQLRREIMLEFGLDEFPPKPYSEAVRRVQQWWGTDFRRAQDPDYWVRKAEGQAESVERMGYIPVFTDVRFPNEADMIRQHGGLIVELIASPNVREKRVGVVVAHESENAMRGYEHMYRRILSTGDNDSYRSILAGVLREAARGS